MKMRMTTTIIMIHDDDDDDDDARLGFRDLCSNTADTLTHTGNYLGND